MYILTVSWLALHGADQDWPAELGTDLDMRLLDGLVLMHRGKLSLTCNPTGKTPAKTTAGGYPEGGLIMSTHALSMKLIDSRRSNGDTVKR